MTGNGSISVCARNISTCIAEFYGTIGDLITSKTKTGLSARPNQPSLTLARNYAAARSSEKIAWSVPKRFLKTLFVGLTQKLLPKVSFMVVLSAPKKGSEVSIATSTSKSNHENGAASPTNSNAFSASGCRSDQNKAD